MLQMYNHEEKLEIFHESEPHSLECNAASADYPRFREMRDGTTCPKLTSKLGMQRINKLYMDDRLHYCYVRMLFYIQCCNTITQDQWLYLVFITKYSISIFKSYDSVRGNYLLIQLLMLHQFCKIWP